MLDAKQLVVNQTHLGGVAASDVGGAKDHVPDKHQVAKVALVVAHAIVVGNGVVGPVAWLRRTYGISQPMRKQVCQKNTCLWLLPEDFVVDTGA